MNISAIPTEYRGVVFDSKSEAIFARALDLAGCRWLYHVYSKNHSHEWDFLVYPGLITVSKAQEFNVHPKPESLWEYERKFSYTTVQPRHKPTLVEYKPKQPTMTYVKNLTQKARANPVESIVVWGSLWNPPKNATDFSNCKYLVSYPIFCSHGKHGWGEFEPMADCGYEEPYSYRHSISDLLGIHSDHYEEAAKYRFDLR